MNSSSARMALWLVLVSSIVGIARAESVEIRIGHAGPLTGNLSRLGKDIENGVRLALEQANAAGIRIGGKEAIFVLVSEDDQANPKLAPVAAQKLVAAGVVGVVGHMNSSASLAAASLYNQAGIPAISPAGTAPRLTSLGYRGQFRVCGRDDDQGPILANYLASRIKPRIVALIDDSTAYGELLADDTEAQLKVRGIAVIARQKGTDKTTDWGVAIGALKAARPGAVVYGGMDDTAGPLLKQARNSGIDAPFLFGDGACTDAMSRLAGAEAEGLICAQPGLAMGAASPPFTDAFRQRFKTEPIFYSPFAYDAANALVEAMKAADSADPKTYLVELKRLSYMGATGRVAFGRNGDRMQAPYTMYTMKGGRLEPVAIVRTEEAATKEREAIAPQTERTATASQVKPPPPSCDSGSASKSTRFTVKDAVAVDRVTGLTWQRCSVGQHWSATKGCVGEPKSLRWNEIASQARQGWRIPTQGELSRIQAMGCTGPAIDIAVFPNTPGSMFWSSTVYDDGNPGFAFFGSIGGGGSGPADDDMYLRLVRDR